MEKLKIAITQIGNEATNDDLVRQVCDDPVMIELCTPVFYDEEKAYRELDEENVDALVLFPSAELTKKPKDSVEIVVTDKTNFMLLSKEPTAEDIIKFRDILERDFDLCPPRIAIVKEGSMQNPDLASQVTTEQSINTYGPYTVEQIMAEDAVCHFDGIITDEALMQRLITELSENAPARFFAGLESVITALYQPVQKKEEEDGLTDVSALTKPIYTAIDIIRNRAFYGEARQDVLPKLFRDKREDRKTERDTAKGSEEATEETNNTTD